MTGFFTGTGTAMVTPFSADGGINYEAFGKMIEYMGRHPRICNLREQNGKRSMVVKEVPSVQEAIGILQEIMSLKGE